MPLLEVKSSKKVTITCALEDSTAIQVNQYAAFLSVPADDVVNTALEYVFNKDREFQLFRESSEGIDAPTLLRVKKSLPAQPGAKRGPKRRMQLAAV